MTVSKTFDTPDPVNLYVEFAAGRLDVTASPRSDTTVEVTSTDFGLEERVTIEQQGGNIVVVVPKAAYGIFRRLSEITMTIHVPTDSRLHTKTASADVRATGRFSDTYTRTGSGDTVLGDVAGSLSAKSGSGDISAAVVSGTTSLASGSGDLSIQAAMADTSMRTGSGDLSVGTASADLSATTGSGRLAIGSFDKGELRGRLGSGDARIGIPHGVAVWTDIQCSGGIKSTLPAMGAPAAGEPFVRVHLRMGSGSVHLDPVPADVVADQLH